MKKLFVIGGMGAGKSTAVKSLCDQGLPKIDLDKLGHETHKWDSVKEELSATFGADVLDENGDLIRSKVAERAFASPAETRKLNRITMPRIEQLYEERISEMEAAGHKACVVEYSAFRNRMGSIAYSADVVLAILAPLEVRIQRAVESGFDEADVRKRISRQITDADRIDAADKVFNNTGTKEELYNEVLTWWFDYKEAEGL